MRKIIRQVLERLIGMRRRDNERIGRLPTHVKTKEPLSALNGQLILPGIGTPYEWK